MKIWFLCFYFVTFQLSAAIKLPKDELVRYRTEVIEMGARLSSLEKEINSKSGLYHSSIEQIKQFESDVSLYRDELKNKKLEVEKAEQENKKILQSYLLESESDVNEPWQKKIHLELFKKAQLKFKEKKVELEGFELKVSEFDEKLNFLHKNEEELSQVIKELETRKKIVMENYLTKVEIKKKIENKVKNQTVYKRVQEIKKELSSAPVVASKPDRYFSKPVDDFLSFVSGPKGVTFKYLAAQPVKAVGEGKVVFAGDLASYGQVILIDHGNDLRTVLLGKMNIKVKKNDSVKNGQVLGYTTLDSSEAQNLYFEVRKKNTAQNTILWLDQNGVSKI